MMHDGPPAKRRRTEAAGNIKFVRDTDIWMDDGSVILGTADLEDYGVVHVFKCHMSTLTKQSLVCASLFTLP